MNAAAPQNIVSETAWEDAAEHYHRYGWAHLRGFFDAAQTARILRHVDDLVELPELPGRQMVYREQSLLDTGERVVQRIEDFCSHHAELDALVRGNRLQAMAQRLAGGPLVLFKDKINFKLPGGGGFEPHQDQAAGWSKYASLFVTAMVTLDAATVENGCLEIARTPRLQHLLGPEWEPLARDALGEQTMQPVPTAAGDAVFFDSYVLHASAANLSRSPRRVLYVTYNGIEAGDQRARYYADKRAAFPPDIERQPGIEYRFRV
jgi:ectoine hydroxylase-related dioxygenase (phytanoyl-CoA dioxygenase family)